MSLGGAYVYTRYRLARPPAIGRIPAYVTRSQIPVADIAHPDTEKAGVDLRNLARTARPGCRVADERFLASKGEFIWDVLRHDVESYLESAGYAVERDGWSDAYKIVGTLYRRRGLRRWFNDDAILIAGVDKPITQTAAGENVHLYGYFRLVSD